MLGATLYWLGRIGIAFLSIALTLLFVFAVMVVIVKLGGMLRNFLRTSTTVNRWQLRRANRRVDNIFRRAQRRMNEAAQKDRWF